MKNKDDHISYETGTANQELEKFISAQERDYLTALTEISKGKKRSHWMWYIFPQIRGLGLSETAKYYAIKDLRQANAYLHHPLLGPRLMEISERLLCHKNRTAHEIFGSPDDLKLRSSMSLFSCVAKAPAVFQQVLDAFFSGEKDNRTLRILGL
ncbi:DUF1810 domain-containing protein [Pedobacter miscanthi]|uniref:DUF1810 domain-containing protein n=1 Tax=Pedobacter miscanthi TaxID=2259170 RepID=A0A366LD72_9SPHI|nr:DUF1810 domain-containing protein [Pedobacter miscanthi]RBQ11847.1 DUF1810 domain-containing protein [Pedobacter miscanthi]